MTKEQALAILRDASVLLEGHFLLTSGRHSAQYLQCARIFRRASYSEAMCGALAEHFRGDSVDIVIGPALGAVQMAYEVGRQLGCENFFAERENGAMALRRGFEITPGQRVLVVEDVVTTGGSVREVINLTRAAGGTVVGVGAIVDRTGGAIDFGVPFRPVVALDVASWEADDCPLCKRGAPAPYKPGSRK
ncbi:MAG: orotate phosphoribosyltransferase [Oscillospiraceae bacterium]|nr:orotate phosphoribosyltransferase [Oscillospiraceae bacterium]